MDAKTRTTTLAVSAASLAWLVPYAAKSGSFEEPSTYIGIAIGAVIALTAWGLGRRRAANA